MKKLRATNTNTQDPRSNARQPLYLIVGDYKIAPCDQETFNRFKLWVAEKLTDGNIDCYTNGNVTIEHWDDQARDGFPHLLNPCDCGIYLPMDVDPGPMLSSAIGLTSELTRLNRYRDDMEPAFRTLMDALLMMAQHSLETNTALEIH